MQQSIYCASRRCHTVSKTSLGREQIGPRHCALDRGDLQSGQASSFLVLLVSLFSFRSLSRRLLLLVTSLGYAVCHLESSKQQGSLGRQRFDGSEHCHIGLSVVCTIAPIDPLHDGVENPWISTLSFKALHDIVPANAAHVPRVVISVSDARRVWQLLNKGDTRLGCDVLVQEFVLHGAKCGIGLAKRLFESKGREQDQRNADV